MSNINDNIKQGYWLKISHWWGLGSNPGVRGIFIYPKGDYIFKEIIYTPSDDERVTSKEKLNQTDGVIDLNTLNKLQEFVRLNITKDSFSPLYDMGKSIELLQEGKVIKIENNNNLMKELEEILSFKI